MSPSDWTNGYLLSLLGHSTRAIILPLVSWIEVIGLMDIPLVGMDVPTVRYLQLCGSTTTQLRMSTGPLTSPASPEGCEMRKVNADVACAPGACQPPRAKGFIIGEDMVDRVDRLP